MLHQFSLANASDSGPGQELDLVVSQSRDGASLQWGALFFAPGDAMEAIYGGSDIAINGYFQVVAKL